MDESWRMRMGMHGRSPPPRSAARTMSPFTARRASLSENLDPDDFSDVFGGPPQTVLLRKFSGDFALSPNPISFYDEVFRLPEFSSPAKKAGQSWPGFRIPAAASEAFYGNIFAADSERRSRERSRTGSKSKSNSSSVLSSEDLSPRRRVIGEDVGLSSFASKLRPINVPCRWNSTSTMGDECSTKRGTPVFSCGPSSSFDDQFIGIDRKQSLRNPCNGFSRRVPSPESFSIEPNSHQSFKMPAEDDIEISSPSSIISSLCQDPERCVGIQDHVMGEQGMEQDQEENEISSSFVIEIPSNREDTSGEALGIDEAIAWAKERFRAQTDGKDRRKPNSPVLTEGPKAFEFIRTSRSSETLSTEVERQKYTSEGGSKGSDRPMETELLDEKMKSWSAGKEANIRLLLSTLHQILWLNSGWNSVPLTSLRENSQVKKAYQKARLFLHPDKLQQRGATVEQKYIAERAFNILQNAWGAFISGDDLFS